MCPTGDVVLVGSSEPKPPPPTNTDISNIFFVRNDLNCLKIHCGCSGWFTNIIMMSDSSYG